MSDPLREAVEYALFELKWTGRRETIKTFEAVLAGQPFVLPKDSQMAGYYERYKRDRS